RGYRAAGGHGERVRRTRRRARPAGGPLPAVAGCPGPRPGMPPRPAPSPSSSSQGPDIRSALTGEPGGLTMSLRMKNWSVGAKLYLLSVILIACILAVGATGFVGFRTIINLADSLYSDRLLPIRSLGAIMDRVWSAREQLMLHVMTEDPDRMAAY